MKIDVCFSPQLYQFYKEDNNKIVIVVDIFRATTTMCSAFNNGATSIIPVASVDEAKAYKEKGYLVGAERDVKKCDFADFGNSPFDYTKDVVSGSDVVISTTNGTQAIDIASDCYCLTIGAFSNISALADFCISQQKDVIVLCSGWHFRVNVEDTLFGGQLASILLEKANYDISSDGTIIAMDMWRNAQSDVRGYTDRCEHTKRLSAHGLLDQIDYCLTNDTTPLVPIYNKETRRFTING